ncbi:MAG: flavin reductase [Oscillospiraceae bacterium]|nr:flavin reductase [Oscillospiraceae bacterium]
MNMKEIGINELSFNPFEKIGKQWFLITAGNEEKGYNTMTASWGFMGVMWGRNCVQAVVRPCRHTYNYLNDNEYFTVSFFGEEYRSALAFCGKNSGRDCDKAKETGLTPVFTDDTTTFEQAELVLVCRKIYTQNMDMSALSDEMNAQFNGTDPIHTEFIGEIVKVYTK